MRWGPDVPSLHRITVDVDGIERLEARHLRATVSSWLEDDGEHHANVKPFTLTPLHVTGGVTAFDVALLDDARRDRLEEHAQRASRMPIRAAARAAHGPAGRRAGAPRRSSRRRRGGRFAIASRCRRSPSRCSHRPSSAAVVTSSCRSRYPAPCSGTSAHAGTRSVRRMRRLDLDLAGLRLHIERFEGRSETHVDGHRKPRRARAAARSATSRSPASSGRSHTAHSPRSRCDVAIRCATGTRSRD
jgi:hypothetical protein